MSTSTPAPGPGPEIPWSFLDCPTDTLIILISHMLELLIQHNDQVVLTPDALTRFHSRQAPGITVLDYLRRIVKYTNMEKIPLLSLLAYIDTTCQHLPTFTLSSLTVHRFLIAGVCAGSKAQCDVFCTNGHYAKVGGIKVQELNALEREFLKVTEWDLCCNADLLQRYYSSLIKSHGGFTQASEPELSPFTPFPRSNSKPRQPISEDEEMQNPPTENIAGPSSDSGSVSPEFDPTDIKGKRRSADLDSPGSSSRGRSLRRPSRVKAGEGAQTPMDIDESPVSAAASSSIPSSAGSSRSRNIGGGGGLGRKASYTFSEPRLAEAKVDTSHALWEGNGVEGPMQGVLGNGTGRAGSQGFQGVNGGGQTEPGNGANQVDGGQSSKVEHTGHEHHAAHTLKNLVGGIFRHGHTHSHNNHDTAPQPHSVVRSQPIRPPNSTTHPPIPVLGDAVGGENRGMATAPLTPRVRNRDERSPDTRGMASEDPLDVGKRRARVDQG